MLALTFVGYALIAFGINLPYHLVSRDVVLGATILPDLLYALQILAETAVYAIGFSIIIASLFLRLSETTARLSMTFVAAAIFRRICDLITSIIVFGSIRQSDPVYGLFYLVIDLAFLSFAFFLARGQASRFYRRLSLDNRAASFSKNEKAVVPLSRLYPFERFVSKKNPVQYCALILAIVLLSARLASRILYDIDYGLPEDFAEVLIMIAYYIADLLVGVGYYLLSHLTLKRIFRAVSAKETKKESESV